MAEIAEILNASFSHLDNYGLILVKGADATKFLHAQFTGDINNLTSDTSRLTAWCSAQGRVIALLRIARFKDGCALVLPKELMEKTIKRLRMFVLRAQVLIEDISESWPIYGLWGIGAEDFLRNQLGQVPDEPDNTVTTQGNLCIRIAGTLPRFLMISASNNPLVEAIKANGHTGSMQAWNRLDIEATLPQIYAATSEKFLPQMLELEKLGGLSYQKGCYPGQEVIARLHYRGELKRRLFLCRVNTETVWAPGTALYVGEDNESLGDVVAAEQGPEGGIAMLAVLRIAAMESGKILLSKPEAVELRVSPASQPRFT